MDKEKVTRLIENLRTVTHKNLLLLYVLNGVGQPLPMERVYYLTDKADLMDYFEMADALVTLSESGLLAARTGEGGPFFAVSPEGTEALAAFRGRIAQSVRDEIDRVLTENAESIDRTAHYFSRVFRSGENEWTVALSTDRPTATGVTFTVGSHAEAMRFCDRWTDDGAAMAEAIRRTVTEIGK